MHAFLIIGNNDDPTSLLPELRGTRLLVFPFAKIADVRELNNFLRLKLTEKTVVVLKDFDKASEEAQNAFLKNLEEPQPNLTFVLVATNIDGVLPTIASRCEIQDSGFKIHENNALLREEEEEKIQRFMDGEVGEKLKIISGITKREDALKFVNDLIVVAHKNLPEAANVAEAALKLKNALEANGNVGLQLTNFVVSVIYNEL